ncbi:hypothetical protein ACXO4N_07760, partial [Lactobacillus delbrueckii subsp. bulgaricus]
FFCLHLYSTTFVSVISELAEIFGKIVLKSKKAKSTKEDRKVSNSRQRKNAPEGAFFDMTVKN